DPRLFRVRIFARLFDVPAVSRTGRLLHHLHSADADRPGGGRLHRRDDAVPERPDQRPHLRHPRRRLQAGLADQSRHRAGDRRLAGNLELDAVLLHHFAGRPFGYSEGADRSRRNPRRVAMAEFPKTWALFQGGPGSATETLPVYIFMTTWQYFQISKGAAMSYIVMVM